MEHIKEYKEFNNSKKKMTKDEFFKRLVDIKNDQLKKAKSKKITDTYVIE